MARPDTESKGLIVRLYDTEATTSSIDQLSQWRKKDILQMASL